MEVKKILPVVILAIGIIIMVLSLISDFIGIGRSTAFGPKQILGVVIGAVLIIVGLVLKLKK